MLVIHPKDKTTAMLLALYEGLGARVIDDCRSTKEVGRLLHHVSTQERIMLLGHGSDKGLFFREDDSRTSSTESLWGIPTLTTCAGTVVTSWRSGAMPTSLRVPRDYTDCSLE